jgi:hypothetical protein
MKYVPCRYCETRYLGCHGRCEKYIEYKRDREVFLQKRFAEEQESVALGLRIRNRVDHCRRRTNR